MNYGKIVVKNNYEKKNDLVFRPLVRAYKKIGVNSLMEGDSAVLLGVINEEDKFVEVFTKEVINYDEYEHVSVLDAYYMLAPIKVEQANMLRKVIGKLVFNKEISEDLEISTMEDLARDRGIEFQAFNDSLTSNNVYSEPYNGYNDFNFKLEKVKKNGK